MKKTHLIAAAVGASILALSQGAGAAEPVTRYNDAIESCLAQLSDRLNLDDATRVRHLVNLRQTTGIGKVMEIDTAVYLPGRVRSYSTYCVADGSNVPVKFRFEDA